MVTCAALACVLVLTSQQQARPAVTQGDVVLRNFRFASGETLPELRMHYRTLGTPRKDGAGVVRNAVLIMHGTTGSGAQFLADSFAGELFGPGQLLDAAKYFIILPDDIGHGASSKPSDGLRARFPRYGYADMVEAEYRLLTEGLQVHHLRLAMGTSMGGMHTWLWASRYPRDQAGLERAGDRFADERQDGRPRHSHAGLGVEGISGGTAEADRAVIARPAAADSEPQHLRRRHAAEQDVVCSCQLPAPEFRVRRQQAVERIAGPGDVAGGREPSTGWGIVELPAFVRRERRR
jgi:pimeloyl-ACP methyl ester carboxylesterase